MMSVQRQAAIAHQMQRWHARAIPHDPIHPHLGKDTKSFAQALDLGRLMEELVRPLLYDLFPAARIIAHCDTNRDTRPKGKRAWLAGREVILPDFEIYDPAGMACFLDVKGKQCHSYYHLRADVQQFVDKKNLEDYLLQSAAAQIPALVLIHLWPSQVMHRFGLSDEARIHTGTEHPVLPRETLGALLQQFPVDDAYYLANATQFVTQGRLGRNEGAPGYYLSARQMFQGRAAGMLPSRAQWQQACALSARYQQGA